jgi:hypothetical protein
MVLDVDLSGLDVPRVAFHCGDLYIWSDQQSNTSMRRMIHPVLVVLAFTTTVLTARDAVMPSIGFAYNFRGRENARTA